MNKKEQKINEILGLYSEAWLKFQPNDLRDHLLDIEIPIHKKDSSLYSKEKIINILLKNDKQDLEHESDTRLDRLLVILKAN